MPKNFDHYDELDANEIALLIFITAMRGKSPADFSEFCDCSIDEAVMLFSTAFGVWVSYLELKRGEGHCD